MGKPLLCLLWVACLCAGCFKKENDCAARNITAPDPEVKLVAEYLAGHNIPATRHQSGLYYRTITEGSGRSPAICSSIKVNFSGTLPNGTRFEGDNGVALNLRMMLESWRIALPLMKEGGRVILYVPPTLGYGSTGKQDKDTGAEIVAPDAPIIIYDITFLSIN
ncbi:MAG: FKBP-type peptidyl-prolyl cis-trans isomerase [Candidatus Pseudobacter hemicellulosilyticus]|uniref:Peptidyl-prolyl cis-trans isomerase n=1 Tax=Candidatus Pseudobacter hemicellulosilyticus TaxID=3121375 RepID=A0AAJ6BGB5_9BACT|nr:MAG: FKBP-type peptidyl-prolyl cis-trans isomerase [Pseudobacter sp.]